MLDAMVYAHYFYGGCDWWLTEYEPETGNAFGFVILNFDANNAEWGYFNLSELERVGQPYPLVDTESDWEPISMRDALQRRALP